MDQLEDEIPEILDLIQKEGLIEKDKDGQWRVTPRGVRRIQDRAWRSCSSHSAVMRWDGTTPRRKAKEAMPSRTPGLTFTAIRWRISNLHETLKNAYIRQGGGIPIRARTR